MMIAAALLAAMPACTQASGTDRDGARPSPKYAHAYHLILDNRPTHLLLLTSKALEQLAADRLEREAILLVTYQLDSVLWVKRDVEIPSDDVRAEQRHVRLQPFLGPESRQWYRYKGIDIDTVRRLLEHPQGTIPVHRPGTSREDLDAILEALERPE